MRQGFAHSPFGTLLLAESEKGLCWLSFVNHSSEARKQLATAFPAQTYSQDDAWASSVVNNWIVDKSLTINLASIGTSFQMTVWNTLLKVPLGSTLSYSDLAKKCGHPTAVRAVATAVGRNPIAIFIPCHRVLPKNASLGNYRWGADKKRALLEWERNVSSSF